MIKDYIKEFDVFLFNILSNKNYKYTHLECRLIYNDNLDDYYPVDLLIEKINKLSEFEVHKWMIYYLFENTDHYDGNMDYIRINKKEK